MNEAGFWAVVGFLFMLVYLSVTDIALSCDWSWCAENTADTKRTYITNTHRQKVGDLYDPGHSRRVQIRNSSRQIIGYIEADGDVTNTSRQKKVEINE